MMQSKNNTFLILLLIIFSFTGSNQGQDFKSPFEEQINTTFIGVDPKVEEYINDANARIKQGDFTGAVRLIQSVMEGDYDGLIPKGKNEYQNVKTYCEELLYSGPPELLAKYREFADIRVKEVGREADPAPESIVKLAYNYALASEGDIFLFNAGTILFEKGLFSASFSMYEKILRYFPGKRTSSVLPAGYAAAVLAGNRSGAEEWKAKLLAFGKPVQAGTRTMDPEDVVAAFSLEKKKQADMPDKPEALVPIWKVGRLNSFKAGLVLEDRVLGFSSATGRMNALSLITGMPLWGEGTALTESEVHSLFKCGPDLFGAVLQKSSGSAFYSRGGGISGRIALLNKKNGEQKDVIEIPGERSNYFDTEPVFSDNKLYFGYQSYEKTGGTPEVYVACYDIRTGTLLWNTFICQGQGSMGGVMLLQDARLIYLTNKGVVAGISIFSGKASWAFRYPSSMSRGYRSRDQKHPGKIVSDGKHIFCLPSDALSLHVFSPDGRIIHSRTVSGVTDIALSGKDLILIGIQGLQKFTTAKDLTVFDKPGKDTLLFEGGSDWLFYATPRAIGTWSADGELKEITFANLGVIPDSVKFNGTYLTITTQGFTQGFVTEEHLGKTEKPIQDLLNAQADFSVYTWDEGEAHMAVFLKAAGESFIYEGADLKEQAVRILAQARIQRGEQLFRNKEFKEAAVWFTKAVDVSTDPETVFHGRFRLAVSLKNGGMWQECVDMARFLIEKYPQRVLSLDSGIRMTAREYGISLISEAITAEGRDVYRRYEVLAGKLFADESYEELINMYPNSSFFVRALKARADQLDEAGKFMEALKYIRQYAAYAEHDRSSLSSLQQRYSDLAMKGAADELAREQPVIEDESPELKFPLYSTWVSTFDPKIRNENRIGVSVKYLDNDSDAVYYEYSGELEKRSLRSGELLWKYTPGYGWLGINLGNWGESSHIEIRGIFDGMPAKDAGFLVGDVITEINGKPFDGTNGFIRLVKQYRPGDEISFTFNRNGKKNVKKLKIGRRPEKYLLNDIASIHVYNDRIIIERNFRIECIEKETGKEMWKIDDYIINRTEYNKGTFCVVTDTGLYYHDAATGNLIWQNPMVRDRSWTPVFAGNRFLILYKPGFNELTHVFDRFTGRHLYSLDANPYTLSVSEKGFLMYEVTGKASFHEYRTGKELWNAKLPFPVRNSRSIFVAGDGSAFLIWVLSSGGALFRDGKLVRTYNTLEDKRVKAVSVSEGKLLAVSRTGVRLIELEGREKDIEYKEPLNGYPRQIERIGERYAAVVYSFMHKTKIMIVDLEDSTHSDTVEIGKDMKKFFTSVNGLFYFGNTGMEAFSYLSETDALLVIEECTKRKTPEAALRGAKIALKMGIPEKGMGLIAPFRTLSGEMGTKIQNIRTDLRRGAFMLSPVRMMVHPNKETSFEITGNKMYQPELNKLKVGKDTLLKGKRDLSGKAVLSYTEEYFIIKVQVTDDILVQAASPDRLPESDAVVLTVDIPILKANVKQVGKKYQNRYIFLIGTSADKPVMRGLPPVSTRTVLTGTTGSGSRVYTLQIPWGELTVHGNKLPFLQLGIMIQDNDGKGVKGELNWTPASIPGSRSISGKFLNEYLGTVVFE